MTDMDQKVINIIADTVIIPHSQVNLDESLDTDWDLPLIFYAIGQEFGIPSPTRDEVMTIDTGRDLIAYIERKMNA